MVAELENVSTTLCWLYSSAFSLSAVNRAIGYLRSGEDFSSSQERQGKVSKFSARGRKKYFLLG